MKSSDSSSFSSPSSSSLNASTVESFQFSPCHDHRCCMGDGEDCNSYGYHSPSKVRLQHQPADSFLAPASEISSEERFPDRRCRQKQTLAQLMRLHACLSDEEEAEEELLLNMRCRSQEQQHSSPKQQKSLLVQALCGGRKSTSTVPTVVVTESSGPPLSKGAVVNPLLQRNNASTRRRCNAPSPLRNANNSPGSTCCGRTRNHVVDCTVVRSRSAGNIPSHGEYRVGSHQEFLTKSKSTGAAVYVVHGPNSQLHGPNSPSPSPRGSNSATKRSLSTNSMLHRDRSSGRPLPSSIPFQSRSNSRRSSLTYSWSNSFQSRNSISGSRPSFTYSKTSSVNSSSNHSIQSAIDRYQQHKNIEVEHKRRSSFLPYRSALLSLFFPLPSFWSHPHHHIRST